MNQTVYGGERHGGIGKDFRPLSEGLIGRDQHRATFVAGADEFEQHAGLGLILGDIGQIVK